MGMDKYGCFMLIIIIEKFVVIEKLFSLIYFTVSVVRIWNSDWNVTY